VSRVCWFPNFRWVLNPAGAAIVLWLRGQPHSELQGVYQVERSEGGPCKASATVCPKKRHHETLLKPSGPGHRPSRRIWARAGSTSSEGALSRPPTHHNQIINPLLSLSSRSSCRLK
jgi:hypothetical protein